MKTLLLSRRARHWALFTLLAAPTLALATVPAHASAAACGDTYTVRPGDSLWSISAACGVAMATIQRLNQLGAYLQPGQVVQLTDPNTLRSYVVQPGDTLSGIAQRLGVAPGTLAAANGLSNPNLLRAGQVLHWRVMNTYGAASSAAAAPTTATPAANTYMTASYTTYQVRPGDTLWGIATAQGVSPQALASANGIANPLLLRPGTVLRIPTVAAVTAATPASQATTAAPSTTTVVNSGLYRVKPGDTLWGIAQALGLTPRTLASTNNLNPAQPLQPGQLLRYAVVVYTGPSPAEVGAVLDQQAAQVGVDDALLRAIAWRESSWRMIDAADGGIGVMQLMPDTVRWLKSSYLPGAWDPHNLSDNIHAGAVLLLVYSHLYGGDVTKIAMAYHGGMGTVGLPPTPEMARYVQSVTAFRQAFLNGIFPM